MASTSRSSSRSAVTAVNISRIYGSGDAAVLALNNVSAHFPKKQMTAIMGSSGSGKSTLLQCLAGLDRPDEGTVLFGDLDLGFLDDDDLTVLRREEIGFIFQAFNLIPTLTAKENIQLPLDLGRKKPESEWWDTVIETLDLGDRLSHLPSEMSGGQQQRVACARALITKPAVIFADEPTGNLDSKSSEDLMAILRKCVDDLGQSVILVTHDAKAGSVADRVLFLADGAVVAELDSPTEAKILDQNKRIDRASSK